MMEILRWILLLVSSAAAHLDVFISKPEVKKLMGLDYELYYVHGGVTNTYAMSFIVPVPAHISDLEFSWRSDTKPLPYVISILYEGQGALLPPQVNISERGTVPVKVQTFRVSLPCSGLRDAEIQVRLQLNISAPDSLHDDTRLNIRRNKICLRDIRPPVASRNDSVRLAADSLVTSGGTFYVAAACALAMIFLVVGSASALYFRSKKFRNHDSIHTSYTTAAYGSHGNVFIRLDALGRPASACSGSYATIASIHKFPLGSRRSPSPYATTQLGGHIYARPEPPAYFPPTGSCCASDHLTTTSQVSWSSDKTERLRRLAVQRSAIRVAELIQEGTFGRLFQGELYQGSLQQDVVVKTVSEAASKGQVSLLVTEGSQLAGMTHDNLLSPLAVFMPPTPSSPATRPLIVYPYCSQGNLKRFLSERRSCATGGGGVGSVPPLAAQLVLMAAGAARGLVYLHARRIAHRDVAARNCVVDDNFQVKVTDNALSRDLFPADYHCLGDNENRPVKWMALEALQHGQFSPASDVWSFGVLLWELVTLAQEPFAEVDPFEVAAFLRDGYRLSQPLNCPDELFTVMSCCWLAAVDARPSLVQLLAFLQDFQTALAQYI